MSYMIQAVISIALLALIALATVYYGGPAFTQGSAKAAATTVVAQSQQISAANTLYANDFAGESATNVALLVTDGYLSSAPTMSSAVGTANLDLTGTSGVVTAASINNKNVCDAINKQVGLDSTTTELTADNISVQYDCFQTVSGTTGSYTFNYH